MNNKNNASTRKLKPILIIIIALVVTCIVAITALSLNCDKNETERTSIVLTNDSNNREFKNSKEVNNSETSLPEAIGGGEFCFHDPLWDSYHSFDNTLIEYVGIDKYSEWLENALKAEAFDNCIYGKANIYNFIHHFNISREMLADLYYHQATSYISGNYYSTWYNLDLLYNGTEEEYSALYKEKGEEISAEISGKYVESMLKRYLIDKYGKEDERKVNCPQFSIAEFVYEKNISRSDLEEAINTVAQLGEKQGYKAFTYNLDLVYNKDKSIMNAIELVSATKLYPVQVDELIREK
jgi:hypothetical protein